MKFYRTVTVWWVGHPRLWALVIGGLIGIPFVFPILLPLAYIGYFLLWRFIYILPQSTLPALLSLIFGLKALLALSWFWSTVPITWLPELSFTTQVVAVFLYWVTSAVWLASAGVVLAVCVAFIRRWSNQILTYCLPLAVVAAEYIAAVMFSIMTTGPGGTIGGGFSFGHTGYLFPWLYPLAMWGGVYAVGVFALFIIAVLHRWYETQLRQLVLVIPVVLIGLFGFSFFNLPSVTLSSTIALVQTDSLPRVRIADLEPLVSAALMTGAAYVLLPEDSRYFSETYQVPLIGSESAAEAWRIVHPTSTAVVVDSGRTAVASQDMAVQRAFLWSSTTLHHVDKSYLVPQGEYMPSFYAVALRLLGLRDVADTLQTTINYVPGPATLQSDTPSFIPNILFCFESVSPLAAKRLQTSRPSNFIVHPMSHSWFHTPTVLWLQLETMLRFQSVYAAVPIVSVGNDVRGSVYLPNGRVGKPETVVSFPEGTVDIIRPLPY